MKTLNELQDMLEGATSLSYRLEAERDSAVDNAYNAGFEAGLKAQALDLAGKTVVIHSDTITDDQCRKLSNALGVKVVFLTTKETLTDLHRIDLKAIGLQRIPE